MPCPLHGQRDVALNLGGMTEPATRQNAPALVDTAREAADLLVVNLFDCAKNRLTPAPLAGSS